MSTPIETNTMELQEILQTVYALPDAGSGSAEPDLVIGLNTANTKTKNDGGTLSRSLSNMTTNDVTVISGSVSDVAEKVKQGLPVKVLLRDIHFYSNDWWYKSIGEAAHVMLKHLSTYPAEGTPAALCVVFFLSDMGDAATYPAYVRINFDIETGTPTWYSYFQLATK